MLFYCYRCPRCKQKCKTVMMVVRPWVECHCGWVFQVPATACLSFQRDPYVNHYRIVRFMSVN